MERGISITADQYKRTEVGELPSDWRVNSLKDHYPEIRNGFVGTATPFYVSNGVKYLQGKNIKSGRILSEGLIYVSEEFHRKQKKSALKVNDIVMVQSGHVGECAVITEQYNNSNCHALIVLTPNNKTDSNYYAYLFNSEFGKKLFHKIKTGNTIEHILASDMKEMRVPTPALEEQQKIATILSTWDKEIELKEKLIEQKKDQKKGLMQKLLTGQIRWNDREKYTKEEIQERLAMINRDEVSDGYKRTKIGIIPIEWEVKKGKHLFSNHSDKRHNGDFEVLSATQDKGIVRREDVGIDIKYDKSNLSSYKKVEVGDFVISLRSFQGGIEYSAFEGIVSPAYTVLRNKVEMEKGFYRFLLKTDNFINRLNSVTFGIRDGKQISYNDFGELFLQYPEIEEQKRITQILDTSEKEITVLEEDLNYTKQQKKGLMQMLLTGKVRVKV